MIVWFFHVKVGHRQTPIPKPPTDVGGFLHTCRFCRLGGRIGVTGVGVKHWDIDVPGFMGYLWILAFELGNIYPVVILAQKYRKLRLTVWNV